MIAGLVVSGNGPRRFLIRAVGPGLTGHGVTDVLHDPVISVFVPSTHESIPPSRLFSADNWGEYADADEVVAASSQVGAFPLSPGSADAALVATLAPGIYTIQASGRGESTGICLVEVYVIPID